MATIRGFGQWLRVVLRRSRVEDELDEELRDHAQRELDRQLRSGVTPEEAVRQAALRTGNLEAAKEAVRDERGGRLIADATADVRVGLRGLRRNLAFTVAVVLSLAHGVAGTTAIFSVVQAVLLRSLPYPDARQLHLVRVWWNDFSASPSPADFEAVREQSQTVGPVAAYFLPDDGFTMLTSSDSQVVRGAFITDELIQVLGISPILGSGFSSDRNAPELLISRDLWQTQFGGRPDVVGGSLTLDGRVRTIVGVMPAGFDVPGERNGGVWVKGTWKPPTRRGPFYFQIVVRLHRDLEADAAASRLTTLVVPVLQARFGVDPQWRYGLRSVQDTIVGDTRRTLGVALGAVGLVLLIAILNVANLLLARGTTRSREFAVRASLGAGRWRLARQVLAESAVLGLLGGALGLGLAMLAIGLVRETALAIVPRMHEVRASLPIALFALGTGIGAALLAALVPVFRLPWRGLADSLRDGGRSVGEGRHHGTARRVLVAAEIAVTLTVLSGAALLAKTLLRLEHTDPGFEPAGVVTFRLSLPDNPYNPERTGVFLEDLESRLRAIPQVSSVAFAGSLPPNNLYYTNNYTLEGQTSNAPGTTGVAEYVEASPTYFDAMGIRLLQGRRFDVSDRQDAPRVAIVNSTFARRHFPGESAIGKRLKGGEWNATAPWTTIVGVAADVPYENGVWGGVGPTVYQPIAQNLWQSSPYIVVKATGDPQALVPFLRAAVRAIDPALPLRDVATMDGRLRTSTLAPRFRSWLALALAGVALALAITGIYGVMTYHVTERRRETAIRRALGAPGGRIVGEVMRSGLLLAAIGIAIGLAGALGASRSLSSLLYQVKADDPAPPLAPRAWIR
jgi:putative ABC transport system permease protein